MEFLAVLWLPIVLSAVLVFVVSSIIHMVLPYHKSDFAKLPDEEAVRAALQPLDLPPGEYSIPFAGYSGAMGSEEFKTKLEQGPVAFMTVMKNGAYNMGSSLIQWFIYSIVVSIFAAYVAYNAIGPSDTYLEVFQFSGAVAFTGYALALAQNSIWYNRKWTTTLKSVFDGLIYALLTAGMFGWLWPGA